MDKIWLRFITARIDDDKRPTHLRYHCQLLEFDHSLDRWCGSSLYNYEYTDEYTQDELREMSLRGFQVPQEYGGSGDIMLDDGELLLADWVTYQ